MTCMRHRIPRLTPNSRECPLTSTRQSGSPIIGIVSLISSMSHSIRRLPRLWQPFSTSTYHTRRRRIATLGSQTGRLGSPKHSRDRCRQSACLRSPWFPTFVVWSSQRPIRPRFYTGSLVRSGTLELDISRPRSASTTSSPPKVVGGPPPRANMIFFRKKLSPSLSHFESQVRKRFGLQRLDGVTGSPWKIGWLVLAAFGKDKDELLNRFPEILSARQGH